MIATGLTYHPTYISLASRWALHMHVLIPVGVGGAAGMRGFGGLFLRVPRLGSLVMTRNIVFLVIGFDIDIAVDKGGRWISLPVHFKAISASGLQLL